MDWGYVLTLLVVLLISLTCHEAAHGLVAMLGGDRTAWDQGLVTINPLPHIRRQPFAMLLLPMLVLYFSGGKFCCGGATAPIDPRWAEKHPKRAALMSLAGPAANLLLAAAGFAAMYWIARPDPDVSWEGAVFDFASVLLMLNLFLAVFNLLPLPPFDGASVVVGLTRAGQPLYNQYVRIPAWSILSFLIALWLLPDIFYPLYKMIADWLPYHPRFRG